jgi:D-glycero-alpha-D-manno-heptose-7-phosphate kinase
MKVREGLEIHHDADLPARSGLGSSSSFTVGLLHAIYALKGEMATKERLAKESIHIEQNMIKEDVGSQDQVSAAYGGFNRIGFEPDGAVEVTPIILPRQRLQELQEHIVFLFTGFSRIASIVASEQIKRIPQNKKELKEIAGMVQQAIEILSGSGDIAGFGKLLHEGWKIKRSLADKISTAHIDNIYETALGAGALGGKLLGAGGGGFMLLFCRPQDQGRIKEKLKKLLFVPCRFENSGSQIAVYYPNGL